MKEAFSFLRKALSRPPVLNLYDYKSPILSSAVKIRNYSQRADRLLEIKSTLKFLQLFAGLSSSELAFRSAFGGSGYCTFLLGTLLCGSPTHHCSPPKQTRTQHVSNASLTKSESLLSSAGHSNHHPMAIDGGAYHCFDSYSTLTQP